MRALPFAALPADTAVVVDDRHRRDVALLGGVLDVQRFEAPHWIDLLAFSVDELVLGRLLELRKRPGAPAVRHPGAV